MLYIYCDTRHPRITYTLRLVFKDLLNQDFEILNDPEAFRKVDGPRISYSKLPVDDELFIYRSHLLSESSIAHQPLRINYWKNLPVFFMHEEALSVFPFDPFALCFYLVTRYEEYLDTINLDKHGRFEAAQSLAVQNDFHEMPLVNIIADHLFQICLKRYPQLKSRPLSYQFIPTYDIDMAFAHLGKNWVRTLGGFGKLLVKFEINQVFQRLSTLLGLSDDPYNNFAFQQELHNQYHLQPVYFVNLGDWSRYDKNNSYKSKRLQILLQILSRQGELGIHPSYFSDQYPEKIKIEKERLECIINKEVVKSRQHFVRLRFPETYERLLEAGIREDYSMGYTSLAGFRASICTPFRFYNLKKEKEENLTIHPFAFMDTVFEQYMKLSNDECIEVVRPLVEQVRSVNGILMGIWHNYSLANHQRKLHSLEEIIKLAKPS